MMIVNTKEMLKQARDNKYCIPHFNINNLEWARFILEECNNLNSPVILGVSEGAIKYMGGYKIVVDIIKDLCNYLNITIPVAIHLDHGSSIESCKEAIDSGFTSVMIDASKYDLNTNIEITKQVVMYAKEHNVTVEAEIGHIGGQEEDGIYAKVEDANILARQTNIDSLAPAIGNAHGIYKGEPKLDFERIKDISLETNLPLVLHGGTGIDDDKLKQAILCGICKININTELQIVWKEAVKKFVLTNEDYDPRRIIKSGENAIKETIKNKLETLGSINKK